jgi:hypothetical protein
MSEICKACGGSGLVVCTSCDLTNYESCEDCDKTIERNAPCQLCCNGLIRDGMNLEGDPRLMTIDLNDPLDINLNIDDEDEPYFESYPWED